MEEFLSSFADNKKVFLGDTDSYTVIQNGYSEDDLLLKIKMATLLYDVVFIPAAYMWQSPQMKEVMYKIQPLLISGNVYPIIRKSKETRDVKDYFEKRQDETKNLKNLDVYNIPSLATEIADSSDLNTVNFLNRLNCCLHLEEKSVKDEFIALWKNDLSISTDINSLSMILCRSIGSDQYQNALSAIKQNVDYNKFSRSTLIDNILKLNLPNDTQKMLQERISWLYLRANSLASQSDFYLSNSAENTLVYKANIGMYIKLLMNFGITEQMMRTLTMNELIQIKKSPVYLKFISRYYGLIESVYYEQTDWIDKINKKINRQMFVDDLKRPIWRKLPAVFSVSGTIFIGLIINYFSSSSINHAALMTTGGIAVSAAILKKLDAINESISDTSFLEFKEYIIKEKYKEKLISCQ